MIDELNRKVSQPPEDKAKSKKDGADKMPGKPNPRTREEINTLKKNWKKSDKKWLLEDTPGFEDHRNELTVYREAWEEKAREASANTDSGRPESAPGSDDAEPLKMCPLGALHGLGTPAECAEDMCGWWSHSQEACGVACIGIG